MNDSDSSSDDNSVSTHGSSATHSAAHAIGSQADIQDAAFLPLEQMELNDEADDIETANIEAADIESDDGWLTTTNTTKIKRTNPSANFNLQRVFEVLNEAHSPLSYHTKPRTNSITFDNGFDVHIIRGPYKPKLDGKEISGAHSHKEYTKALKRYKDDSSFTVVDRTSRNDNMNTAFSLPYFYNNKYLIRKTGTSAPGDVKHKTTIAIKNNQDNNFQVVVNQTEYDSLDHSGLSVVNKENELEIEHNPNNLISQSDYMMLIADAAEHPINGTLKGSYVPQHGGSLQWEGSYTGRAYWQDNDRNVHELKFNFQLKDRDGDLGPLKIVTAWVTNSTALAEDDANIPGWARDL